MNRSTLILVGAFVVLLLIYLGIKSSRDVSYRPEPFAKVDTAKVDGLRIRTSSESLLLKKQGNEWQLAEPIVYPAETRLVRDLVNRLCAMELETAEPLSQDPERDTLFQVNEGAGTQVELIAGKETVANFIMGKNADDARHTYVRKMGDNNIYLVKGLYNSQLTRKIRDWRDKTIMSVQRDSVARIDLLWPDRSFALVKEDSLWFVEEGGRSLPADKQTAEHLASSFYLFRTLEFLDGDSARMVDFSRPNFTISVTTMEGSKQQFSLLLMPTDENRYYLKRDDLDSTVFIIYKGTAEVYMKKPEDFKPGSSNIMQAAAQPAGKPQQPSPEEMQEILKKMKK